MSFLTELKRRKIFQVAIAYAVVAWLLVQIAVSVEDPLNLPDWVDTLVIVLVFVGFPLTMVVSWAYDLRPGHVAGVDTSSSGVHRNELVKLSDLHVMARTSTLRYADGKTPISKIAEELNVRTVMEGSVQYANENRRARSWLRLFRYRRYAMAHGRPRRRPSGVQPTVCSEPQHYVRACLMAYRRLGKHTEARRIVTRIEAMRDEVVITDGAWALACLAVDDQRQALASLNQAVTLRSRGEDISEALIAFNMIAEPVLDQPDFVEVRGRLPVAD